MTLAPTVAPGAAVAPVDVPQGRLGALAGLAFALCLFVGVVMLSMPDAATDAELTAWWSDEGNRLTALVSMHLFVVAGLCFLVFLTRLRSGLRALEGGAGEAATLAFAAGTVFVAMLLVAAVSRGVIAFAMDSPGTGEPIADAAVLRYLPQLGYAATGVGGMLAVAVTMAVTTWVVARSAARGRWLAWVGVASTVVVLGAVAALAGVFAIPAVLLWALATSVALWRGGLG